MNNGFVQSQFEDSQATVDISLSRFDSLRLAEAALHDGSIILESPYHGGLYIVHDTHKEIERLVNLLKKGNESLRGMKQLLAEKDMMIHLLEKQIEIKNKPWWKW